MTQPIIKVIILTWRDAYREGTIQFYHEGYTNTKLYPTPVCKLVKTWDTDCPSFEIVEADHPPISFSLHINIQAPTFMDRIIYRRRIKVMRKAALDD